MNATDIKQINIRRLLKGAMLCKRLHVLQLFINAVFGN